MSEKHPLFTIVISGYQNESFLPKCLESIQEQTFPDFEAICYVEESTDNSLAVCKEMSRKDSRFKLVTAQKSGSASTTRNYAIDHSEGEYLVVVDGDDWLSVDMLEKLANKLHETGMVDVVSFAFIKCRNGEEADWVHASCETNFNANEAKGLFSGSDAIRFAWHYERTDFKAYTWLSVYRVDFLRENHLYQSDGLILEDYEWVPRVWFCAQKFSYLDEALYAYRIHGKSVTAEVSSRTHFDLAHHFRTFIEFIKTHHVPHDIQAIWSNQWLSLFFSHIFYPAKKLSLQLNDEDRKKILKIFFNQKYKKEFWQFLLKSSLPKRLALPLIWLASLGIQAPAKLYFSMCYYPLARSISSPSSPLTKGI